ncbi:DUF3784 domain-containing protein [Macrococcus equipercicus]|uniref:DUF3784 domain-containing protein n=1 Tax=Macrococcus equipercicus TaxID=69967 RepID=A0A9Q9F3K3_9STAP|nr:DUF3784 domain-containing protein [Macrococcus equipercicus]UTH14174.1 DUF3784 domain-containing protein [Macrococcus equipercicus]
MIIILLFLIPLAVMFSMGKGAMLIAGYNTMSKDQQNQYDEKKLCQGMGKFLFVVSAEIIALYLVINFGREWGAYVLFAVIFISTIGFNSYMFRTRAYKK